jgi:hypothetical protein
VTSAWRALLRRTLTPDVSETSLEVRGFHVKDTAARERLETVGKSFLGGFAHAIEARSTAEAEERLEKVPGAFRGFAYEGAAMSLAILDALPIGGGGRVERFLRGRADQHVYMAYIGVGWAMARLPRWRWSRLPAPDPLLRWLVLDGYGFHQAYFHTARYVEEQFTDDRFRWPTDGPRWYASRVIDQGVGRAMWFVGGADAALVATMVEKFPEHRRSDLYSGAGLAASYAGGADEEELRLFWERAGKHRPSVAQASAFAAEARVRAGLVQPHNELATRVFCGMSPVDAARITLLARPTEAVRGHEPAYEVWRQRVAGELVSLGRC